MMEIHGHDKLHYVLFLCLIQFPVFTVWGLNHSVHIFIRHVFTIYLITLTDLLFEIRSVN